MHAPQEGTALEIASGTGQHAAAFARAFPKMTWQPTDVDEARLLSIETYRKEACLPNLSPAIKLDATRTGWHRQHADQSLVIVINLLHLVSVPQARTVVTEAVAALATGGSFILYGPFMRRGALTSPGDARFHAELTDANPDIGYKNSIDVEGWMRQAGARTITTVEMPANNLAFVIKG